MLVLESAPVKALEDNQTVMQCNITDNTPLLRKDSFPLPRSGAFRSPRLRDVSLLPHRPSSRSGYSLYSGFESASRACGGVEGEKSQSNYAAEENSEQEGGAALSSTCLSEENRLFVLRPAERHFHCDEAVVFSQHGCEQPSKQRRRVRAATQANGLGPQGLLHQDGGSFCPSALGAGADSDLGGEWSEGRDFSDAYC